MENIFKNKLKKYFPFLSYHQIQQFDDMIELYKDWNTKINVISRKDIDNIFIHHILHSLSIAKIINFKDKTRILDVGTGGGFPGIPLAVIFPNVEFHLIDRIGKKIKVVNEIANGLDLKNITATQVSCEENKQKYDFIVSRAVCNISDFVKITKNKFLNKNNNDINNGILYLKGANVEEELINYNNNYTICNISDFFEEEFFNTKTILYLPMIK